MNEIMKKLDEAYRLLSTISVSGDSVDVMAFARAKLRAVYNDLGKLSEEKQEGEE